MGRERKIPIYSNTCCHCGSSNTSCISQKEKLFGCMNCGKQFTQIDFEDDLELSKAREVVKGKDKKHA